MEKLGTTIREDGSLKEHFESDTYYVDAIRHLGDILQIMIRRHNWRLAIPSSRKEGTQESVRAIASAHGRTQRASSKQRSRALQLQRRRAPLVDELGDEAGTVKVDTRDEP